MKSPAPFIAMSATFRQKDQDRITKLLAFNAPDAIACPLDRRDILWWLFVSGDPMSTIKTSVKANLRQDPDS